MRWLFTGKGMLTYSPSIVAASVKVLEESATPDMQVTFAPGSFKGGQIGELEETPGLSAGAWQMRPLSRGYVEAKSNRPGDMPAINPRYLSEEPDRRAIIIGWLRFAADEQRHRGATGGIAPRPHPRTACASPLRSQGRIATGRLLRSVDLHGQLANPVYQVRTQICRPVHHLDLEVTL